jgi:hypothetical protein
MHIFTKRNALLGWVATRIARKRLERRLNALAGHGGGRRRRFAVRAGLAAGLAVVAGAFVARRSAGHDNTQTA